MSDSDAADVPSKKAPSDATLEKSLRQAVRKEVAAGSVPTVNKAREVAEKSLKLNAGFFKDSEKWKGKSKDIIKDEFDKDENTPPEPVAKPTKTQKPKAVEKPSAKKPVSKKRASPAAKNSRPRKKARKSESDEEEDISDVASSIEDASDDFVQSTKPTQKKLKAQARRASPVPSNEEMTDHDGEDEAKARIDKPGPTQANNEDTNDSDLSSVIDEPPKSRKKSTSTIKDATMKGAAKPKKSADDDPDVVQIRTLQGQLAKCGIRKVWGKELKPFDTAKQKIDHLRQMLNDAGMTGRFSEEKARQLKEERELKADLDAVQEGNQAWGVNDDDRAAGEPTSRSRAAKTAKKTYDFLSDGDGEETD